MVFALLFESYVGHYLNDIVIKKKDKNNVDNIVSADNKWKFLSKDKTHQGVSQADMYQLYAYGTKYKNCKQMNLIYPKDKDAEEKEYHYYENKSL